MDNPFGNVPGTVARRGIFPPLHTGIIGVVDGMSKVVGWMRGFAECAGEEAGDLLGAEHGLTFAVAGGFPSETGVVEIEGNILEQ